MAVTTTYTFQTFAALGQTGLYGPQVAGGSGGYAFSTYGATVTAYAGPFGSQTFSTAITGGDASLALLTGGGLVAVSEDADSVIYRVFAANGTPVTATLDTFNVSTFNSDVAALNNGGFVIAFQDLINYSGGSDNDIQLYFYTAGGVPQAQRSVMPTAAEDRNPTVAVLANNNVAVAWERLVGGETEIWYAVYSSDGTSVVKTPTLLDTSGPTNRDPQITATEDGFAIAYRDNDTFNLDFQIAVRTLDFGGNPIGSIMLGDVGQPSITPTITKLSNGELVVSWGENANVIYALLDISGQHVLTQQVYEFDPSVARLNPEIAAFGSAARFIIGTDIAPSIGYVGGSLLAEVGAVKVLTSDAAADTIIAQNGMSHHLFGNGGNDKLYGAAEADFLVGGEGADILDGRGGNDLMRGGADSDSYFVDSAGDVIDEGLNAGTDKVTSTAIDYQLSDNVEALTLAGAAITGRGNDGANTLTGNSNNNFLYGGAGKDKLDGKAGSDRMEGGDGNDTYYVDNAGDLVVETDGTAAGGKDLINIAAGAGAYYVLDTYVENGTLTSNTVQTLYGNNLANTLTSKANSSQQDLFGYGGNDVLKGGSNSAFLRGGAGKDTMTGGLGTDGFVFENMETSANRDTITDFNRTDDTMYFAKSVFTGLSGLPSGFLPANAFRLGTTALDADDRIIYNQAKGELWYDADGTGASAQILVAVLSNQVVIAADDIVVF